MKKHKKSKIVIITIAVFLLISPILFNIAIMIVNDLIAVSVKNDLQKLPLPENTEIICSYSVAGKVVGNGNGMQYFGAILIKSELSLDELSEYYFSFNIEVREQKGKKIKVLDHGRHTFEIEEDDCYIVYDFDWRISSVILEHFDLRGH